MPKTKGKNTAVTKKAQPRKKSQGSKIQAVKTKATQTKEDTSKKASQKAQDQGGSLRLSAPVFDIKGRSLGKVGLPKDTFGQKINEKLMAQAVRVYFANQNPKTASVKTRAEVRGGGRKPHRQKGTGRARAGSIRSPL